MDRLIYLYLATGTFGAGVMIVLFFTSAFSSGDEAGDEGAEDADIDMDDGGEADGDMDDAGDSGDEADTDSNHQGSYMVDYNKYKSTGILNFLSLLRTSVFFCVGFGTVGTFALLTGIRPLNSLFWSIPVGLVSVVIFRTFKSIQQKKLDSSINDNELLQQRGVALLPFGGDTIGKVKIQFGSLQIERYAKCDNTEESITKGDAVVVYRTDDEYVYVRKIK